MAPGSDRTTHSSAGTSSQDTSQTLATTGGHPALHPEIVKHVSPAGEYDYITDEAEREMRDWGGDAPALPFFPRKRGLSNAALHPISSGASTAAAAAAHVPPTFTRPTADGAEVAAADARAGAPFRKRTRSGTVWSEGGYPELTHVDTAFSDAHRAFSRLSRHRTYSHPLSWENLRTREARISGPILHTQSLPAILLGADCSSLGNQVLDQLGRAASLRTRALDQRPGRRRKKGSM